MIFNSKYLMRLFWVIYCLGGLHCVTADPLKTKIATVRSLMDKMNRQDVPGIIGLFGTDLRTSSKSEEVIRAEAQKVHLLFARYGLPTDSVFQMSTESRGPYKNVIITVPIFHGLDTVTRLKSASLEVIFGPDELYDAGKIAGYFLRQKFED